MSNIIVSNWKQVYKSLAVILPTVVVLLFDLIQSVAGLNIIPDKYTFILVGISGVLGWVIKQDKIKKQHNF